MKGYLYEVVYDGLSPVTCSGKPPGHYPDAGLAAIDCCRPVITDSDWRMGLSMRIQHYA